MKYREDMAFLKSQGVGLVELSDGSRHVLVAPSQFGSVVTASADGPAGRSHGWVNRAAYQPGYDGKQFDAKGWLERLWPSPEGGPLSVYFSPTQPQDMAHWRVPTAVNTGAMDVVESNATHLGMSARIQLQTYSAWTLDVGVKRAISLLPEDEVAQALGRAIPRGVRWVGVRSRNTFTNLGNEPWDLKTGLLSMWVLCQLPQPGGCLIVPFVPGNESRLGPLPKTDYFGVLPKDHCEVRENCVILQCKGGKRGKVGVSPLRSLGILGRWDPKRGVLVIARTDEPDLDEAYLNNTWGGDCHPFGGDHVNAYTDAGKKAGGLGDFCELESLGFTRELKPNEALIHRHTTMCFEGELPTLNEIARRALGVDLNGLE